MKILLTLALLFSCIVSASAEEGTITQIKLQHTRCYGPCRIDEMTLNADGSAQFAGGTRSSRIGLYRGQIAPDKFAQLARALEEQNFFELRPQIGNGLATDFPDSIVSATRADSFLGAPHSVVFRANYNHELLAKIEAAFAAASAQIAWQKDELASQSGVRGVLTRDLTAYEKRLFADRTPPLTNLRMGYALVELTAMGKAQTVYSTHSDGEGNFQIFAPPGRYRLSVDDLNAAYPSGQSAYLPHWGFDSVEVEVMSGQFAPIDIQLRNYNANMKTAN